MKKIVISIVIVVAVVLVVGFVPLMDVPYQDTESYYEDEPYEATETYYETEPLQYHVVQYQQGYAMEDLPIGIEHSCPWVSLTVLNTDTVSETFTVYFYITVECLTPVAEDRFDFTSNDYQDSIELYLEPGEIGTVEKYWGEVGIAPHPCGGSYWGYEVTGSKTIEKQRTVTKYRQVQRERAVTCYKKGSIFEYLRSRF